MSSVNRSKAPALLQNKWEVPLSVYAIKDKQSSKSKLISQPAFNMSTCWVEGLKQTIHFPLFTELNLGGEEFHMCLYQVGTHNTTLSLCGARLENFEALVTHLNEVHSCNIKHRVDCCYTCHEIFPSTLSASIHYIEHILDYVSVESFCGTSELNRTLLAPMQAFLTDEKSRLAHHVYEEQMDIDESTKEAAEVFDALMEETMEVFESDSD